MKRASEEIANTIEGFVSGKGDQWAWDDFISIRLSDPELEAVRQKCVAIRDQFPPTDPKAYCSEAGLAEMRKIVQDLRARSAV
jgi:hypothetical protein